MNITPDFVPNTEFHTGIWLLPLSRPSWYYFCKKRNPDIIRNKYFLESVDEPLRDLVKFLHAYGIRTTPSCAGHHISEKNFEKIFASLQLDRDEINGNGLMLADIETGKHILFKNKKYKLPWTKERFLEKASNYQQDGVIGLRTGHKIKFKQKILAMDIEGARISQKDGIVFIRTHEDNGGDIRETWKRITESVKSVFNSKVYLHRPDKNKTI